MIVLQSVRIRNTKLDYQPLSVWNPKIFSKDTNFIAVDDGCLGILMTKKSHTHICFWLGKSKLENLCHSHCSFFLCQKHNERFLITLSRAAWCIWGPKAKIDYLVSYIKLLLVNMNHLEFFFFFWFKKVYKHKKIWQNFLHFLMWQIDSSE